MDVTQLDTLLAAASWLSLKPAQWLLLAAALVILLVFFALSRQKRPSVARRKRASLADDRSTHSTDRTVRDLEEVMGELDALAHDVQSRLDARLAKLDALIHHADERIDQLSGLLRPRDDGPALDLTVGDDALHPEPDREGAEMRLPPAPTPHAEVYAHADAGLSAVEVAQKTGRTTGEVELVLALRKTRERTALPHAAK